MNGKSTTTRALEKTGTPGIYKRGGGYVVRWRDRQGKQHQRAAATLAEARVVRGERVSSVGRGERQPQTKPLPFDEYARAWIDSTHGRTRNGLRELTREEYRRALEAHAIPYFGSRPIQSIGPRDLKDLARKIADEGKAANTVRLALAPVRAMFAEAFEDEVLVSNPAARIRLGTWASKTREQNEEPKAKALSEAELRRLLVAVDPQWQLLIELLASTGLRISEALALRWSDLDLGTRRVHVRRRVRGTDTDSPKSKYARRAVPLPPAMARHLWSARQGAADSALVFTHNGEPIQRTAPFRAVRRAAKRAGIGWPVGLHSLRHSYASILFARGASAVQVQRLLGHHSPAFTLSVYVHLLPDDLPDPVYLDELLPLEGVNKGSSRPTENGRDEAPPPKADTRMVSAIS